MYVYSVLFSQVWPILHSLTQTSNGDNFDECDLCLYSVTHFHQFDSFCQMWLIFHSVFHTSKCDNFDECDSRL